MRVASAAVVVIAVVFLVLQRQFIWKGDFREQFEPDNVLP